MAASGEIPAEAMEILRQVSTGVVEDALAMAGLRGGIVGVRPARGSEDAKVVGPAATVLFAPTRPDTPKQTNYRAIRASARGSVLVVDGKGIDGHFAGDNQGEYARQQGLVGVVVYGGARDIAGYRAMGMPLYCTGSATRDKPKDLALTAYNVPVEVGGVLVKPGDMIVADEDGVVSIPAEALNVVMEKLSTMIQVEAEMEKAVKSNASPEEIEAIAAKKKPKK